MKLRHYRTHQQIKKENARQQDKIEHNQFLNKSIELSCTKTTRQRSINVEGSLSYYDYDI